MAEVIGWVVLGLAILVLTVQAWNRRRVERRVERMVQLFAPYRAGMTSLVEVVGLGRVSGRRG